jgi:hypothetical protein
MMRIIRLFAVLVILLFFCVRPASSQDDDFGIWYGISTEYSPVKKLEIDLKTQLRTDDNASKINEGYLEGGLGYKINKHFSLAATYRVSKVFEKDSEYHFRHKLYADVKADEDLGNFNFSLRFRFQRQVKTYYDSENDKIPDYHGRIKLKTEYKTPSFPINPYISWETFCRLFEQSDKRFDKDRYSVGLTYKISGKQSIDAEYTFQRDYMPHISDIHLVSLEYNLKFN